MSDPTPNAFALDASSGDETGEATLRLLARLPAPEDLEDRVHLFLRAAPRRGRILSWPAALGPDSRWLRGAVGRGAAAAAIVCVVAGGGWGVYSRVQPAQTTQVIATPRVAAPSGFSSAGAMRTPQTLNGPVLAHPLSTAAKQTQAKENPARIAHKPLKSGKADKSNENADKSNKVAQ